jgi:hypothetical protein
MLKHIAGIVIPDSKLANEAADVLREYGTPLLWNHSHRVFLFGSLLGREENLKYDGFRHKPETTFGNIKSDVCERYPPDYKRPNFCDFVLQSPWNE